MIHVPRWPGRRRRAQRAVELELEHRGEEVPHVGDVRGDVVLGARVEVGLGARHRRRDALVLLAQLPPRRVVVRGRHLAREHLPAPLVDQLAEGQEGDFFQRHLHLLVDDRFLAGLGFWHQADLREHVVHVALRELAGEPQAEVGAEHRERRAEQHAEGQRPALVLGREDQEHEKQRHAEDDGDGDAFTGFFLLEGHAQIVIAHLSGHGLFEDFLQGSHPLGGAVAGRGDRVDLDGAVEVVALEVDVPQSGGLVRELGRLRRPDEVDRLVDDVGFRLSALATAGSITRSATSPQMIACGFIKMPLRGGDGCSRY